MYHKAALGRLAISSKYRCPDGRVYAWLFPPLMGEKSTFREFFTKNATLPRRWCLPECRYSTTPAKQNPMKIVQNNVSLKGLAGAVLAASLFCLPFINPAHAEETSAGSSASLPADAQLVSLLKRSFAILSQGNGVYGGHRARVLASINMALACYKDHSDIVAIGRHRYPLSKQNLSQAKSLLEQAAARAPKDSEPQRLIEQAIKQTDQCLACHGAD